jgi:septum formation protein
MSGPSRFVLASASPRRHALLTQIGRTPDAVIPPHVDETPMRAEHPAAYAKRMAESKCDAVAGLPETAGAIILAADTVVACGRRILPKTEDAQSARDCLGLLSGRRHRVLGGICLRMGDGQQRCRLVTTSVTFKRLSDAEIAAYIESGEWHGKAGGYAIQGRAAVFVRAINGSYSNVVGLALFEAEQMLVSGGLPLSAYGVGEVP